jgi:hypothetical protein
MKEKNFNALGQLSISYKNEKVINDRLLHQSRLLLEMYRRVVWGVKYSLYDLEATAEEFGSRRIQQLIDFLAFDFEREIDADKIESHLNSIASTHDLIMLIDRALMRLREYPELGEIYFELLNKKYIIKYSYSDQELMESLDLTRSTFYRYKRYATHLLGVILWGYVLPECSDAGSGLLRCAEDTESNRYDV